ncbi:hypothetical protein MNBD_GAMMA10-3120 [hydrothermal vent metagenome]|uniref:Glycosyltransferase 2-like domain-containing protein n=1 Tax=hydrothermal vent metagenome TaxID=652676 RepID=A0A3B0Y1R9_9ZZZZ
MNLTLSILIPVFNEELLLPRAIESAKRTGAKIYVLDSGSSDRTVEIAESYGCIVHKGQWKSFSEKLNWGLSEIEFNTPWVMRLDADEYITDNLLQEILSGALERIKQNVNGIWVGRRIHFLGKQIKYGGVGSQLHVRITRVGKARYEQRLTDEYVLADGEFGRIKGDVVDDPARGLTSWLQKHIAYAETECFSSYNIGNTSTWRSLRGGARYRRFIKENIYAYIPLFIRPFFFWVYRYFILLGFLDGRRGFIYHFLHGFWYRFVIDALIYEAKLTDGRSVKKEHII